MLDEVASASARVAAALDRHRILRDDVVPKAEQHLKVSEAAYVSGKLDFLALLDSERMLLSRQLERERALADQAMAEAELERVLGGPGEK